MRQRIRRQLPREVVERLLQTVAQPPSVGGEQLLLPGCGFWVKLV